METQIHTVWAERVCEFAFRFLQKSEMLGILDLETGNNCRPFPTAALSSFQGWISLSLKLTDIVKQFSSFETPPCETMSVS